MKTSYRAIKGITNSNTLSFLPKTKVEVLKAYTSIKEEEIADTITWEIAPPIIPILGIKRNEVNKTRLPLSNERIMKGLNDFLAAIMKFVRELIGKGKVMAKSRRI